jgi:diguanylate cyclase (GGDEF)-like protein/PAS domain S-box-containing protein
MFDIETKNKKKPNSFKKPNKIETKNISKNSEFVKVRKASLNSQIKELQDEVKLLTSYSSDTIYRLDYRTMKYNYISPAISKLLGFTPLEMKRINFRSLIVETKLVTDGLKKISSFDDLEVQRIKGDVGKWNADYLIRTKSGDKIWVSDVSYPWFDESGKVIGSVGSLRDISERVKIENKIFSDLTKIKTTDALTGLPGKSNFFSSLDNEIKRSKRSGHEVSVAVIEVELNSEEAKFSENILLHVSKLIQISLRETDFVAKMDSAQFAILMPDTNVNGAYYMADRIRDKILEEGISLGGDSAPVKCNISVGISNANAKDNLSATDLFKLADTRLYIAKNTGRNLVSIDEIAAVH